MILRDILSRSTEHVMETYDEDGKTRPPEMAEVERELHEGFTSWSADHSKRYPRMGRLPYRPDIFPDQRIDRPFRPITFAARAIAKAERSNRNSVKSIRPALYLGRLVYFEGIKKAHAKTLGSKALSETIISGFLSTPARGTEYESDSLVDYVAGKLDDNETVGLTGAHLSALADIGEFAGALNIAMAEQYGFKYIDRVNTLINTNMTRQTYKVGRFPVPISWLVRSGTGIFWGVPPGENAEKYGIGAGPLTQANKKFLESFDKHKKEKSMVLAYVPSGSGAIHVNNNETGELEKMTLKDPSFTATLTRWCEGGIIPVNRYGEQIIMGSVIENERPAGISKKHYSKMLTDKVMQEHATQASELTGVPVEYIKLFPETHLARSA
jgi:hypothetical protein